MIPIQGIDPSMLAGAQRNALAILMNLTLADLAALKHEMHLGVPAVVGPTTLTAFMGLAQLRGLDLSDAGVSAFKATRCLAGGSAIGATTAAAYARTLVQAPTEAVSDRHVSDHGRRCIENFEGLRLTAYQDQVGVWTIGYGHTAGVRQGQVLTRDQADEFLVGDLAVAESAVCRLVTVPLTANQFDALVSFTFNVGVGALTESTLLRELNTSEYQAAADQFDRWVHGERNGVAVELAALVTRRAEEHALFLAS